MAVGGPDELTDRERRMLRLLASGHSVKSAAAAEGVSEYAANEVLRASRRKLGTGSSREAARLLVEHEGGPPKNRDEKSVIPVSAADGQSRLDLRKGIAVMIALVFAVYGAVMLTGDSSGSARHPRPVEAPKVVHTVPAEGAEILPGPFMVEVRFDRPMLPQAYSFVRTDEGLYPECPGEPRLSADGRSYSWECVANRPGRYVMYFNRSPYMNFRDAATSASAEPARLEFIVRNR